MAKKVFVNNEWNVSVHLFSVAAQKKISIFYVQHSVCGRMNDGNEMNFLELIIKN